MLHEYCHPMPQDTEYLLLRHQNIWQKRILYHRLTACPACGCGWQVCCNERSVMADLNALHVCRWICRQRPANLDLGFLCQ